MKQLIIYCLVFFISCKNFTGTDNLVGRYTAYHAHEYGKANDTLIVSHANDGDDIFMIERHSSVIRTADGKVFPKRLIIENLLARYNEKEKILEVIKTGEVFIFNSQKQQLVWGQIIFNKK